MNVWTHAEAASSSRVRMSGSPRKRRFQPRFREKAPGRVLTEQAPSTRCSSSLRVRWARRPPRKAVWRHARWRHTRAHAWQHTTCTVVIRGGGETDGLRGASRTRCAHIHKLSTGWAQQTTHHTCYRKLEPPKNAQVNTRTRDAPGGPIPGGGMPGGGMPGGGMPGRKPGGGPPGGGPPKPPGGPPCGRMIGGACIDGRGIIMPGAGPPTPRAGPARPAGAWPGAATGMPLPAATPLPGPPCAQGDAAGEADAGKSGRENV